MSLCVNLSLGEEMEAYYKKIIFKKNAFEDLKAYIKINYTNKKIFLISTKSIPAEDVTTILNSLFCGTESVKHYISRNNFDERELNEIKAKIVEGGVDLIIAFGGGRCADVVKYFASVANLPYIVCPTSATSLAYFTSFCVNPYNPCKSFYAKMPKKIFIQESIIRRASCYQNINGLCFLHSLRAVYLEGIINNDETSSHVFVGIEKLLGKLEYEQTNILLCGEDSNLVLMDLFIDFGFFTGSLNLMDYYLINMYCVDGKIEDISRDFSGKNMLVCAKMIIGLMRKYLEVNAVRVFEKPNFAGVAKILKNYKIFNKKIKNNQYFCDFFKKPSIKVEFLKNKEEYYREICIQLIKLNEFSKKVKSVYRHGIEIENILENVEVSLAVVPFICGQNVLVDYIAGSGVLNSFVSSWCGV